MSIIYVVRHGEDEDNAADILNGHRDTDLTDRGREQARELGEKLRDREIAHIYASPMKRSWETAAIVGEILGQNEIMTRADLIERNFGVLTGRPTSDIPLIAHNLLKTDAVTYFLEADGAEPFDDLYRRAATVLMDLQSRHQNEDILVVTHGDLGKMMKAAYHQWTWEQGLRQPYFDNTDILKLS